MKSKRYYDSINSTALKWCDINVTIQKDEMIIHNMTKYPL